MLRPTARMFCCLVFIWSSSALAQIYTFTENFESSDWFGEPAWTVEGVVHPEIVILQFSDADPFLGGAAIGSASGGLRASKTDYGRYTGGDHGEVYLDFHMKVPPGDYTFSLSIDQLLYWAEWPAINPGQLWGCGQVLYLGDAAELAYGTQQANQAPTGPWISPEFPGSSAFRYMSMGTIWQGSPTNINGKWIHRDHTQMVDGTTTISTTGHLIFRMVMRNKYNISENMAFAMDNLVITLTRLGNCHFPIFFDLDDDGDVDSTDFAGFQRCYTGAEVEISTEECLCLDLDADLHITEVDLVAFMACADGPSVPADPACDD